MLRAAIAAESAGVPTVSLLCEGFHNQARATARGLGYPEIALAGLRGHVDAQSEVEVIRSLREHTIEEIISGLTKPVTQPDAIVEAEPAPYDEIFSGSLDEVQQHFRSKGWTDGSPIIPPTRERVMSYLLESGNDPWRQIGVARPSGRDITVWSVAVNAVMAGCRTEDLPVLLALAEVFAGDHFGVEHSGNTTGADVQVILSGQIVRELGFNHGQGALREGAVPNTTVARWVRLFLRNVHGFTAEEHDKATYGNASHVVLAEDHECLVEIGWQTLGESIGNPTGTEAGTTTGDSVTAVRINGSVLIGSVFGSTPEQVIPCLADGLVRVTGWELTHAFGLGHGQYRPLLIISPLLARMFHRNGWSRQQVQQGLWEHARLPAWKFESHIGEWTNLTAGRRLLVDLVAEGKLPLAFGESADPNRLVPIAFVASDIVIAVAGDPNRANAMAMSNDGLHGRWTTQPVDRMYSTDLQCLTP